jgi:hypothetical protein
MKISQNNLRKLIKTILKEAPFAGDLGSIKGDTAENNISFLGKQAISPGVLPFLVTNPDGSLPDDIQKKANKQRRTAGRYASSDAFKREAEKRYQYLDANIYVLSQIGSFTFKPGTVSEKDKKKYLTRPISKRVTFNNLDTYAFDFLKKVKPDIDLSNVKNTDTVIYYQTDTIGGAEQTFKMTPWMIMHAIFDNGSFSELVEKQTGFDYHEPSIHYHSSDSDIVKSSTDIMTTGSARYRKNSRFAQIQLGDRQFSGDAMSELLCQELLTKKGVHFNRENLSDEQNLFLDKTKLHVKKIAKWFREYIKGKLIIVDGHISNT